MLGASQLRRLPRLVRPVARAAPLYRVHTGVPGAVSTLSTPPRQHYALASPAVAARRYALSLAEAAVTAYAASDAAPLRRASSDATTAMAPDTGSTGGDASLGAAMHAVTGAYTGPMTSKIRAELTELSGQLKALGADDDDRRVLQMALQHLDELFLVMVAGEFNSGKSTLLNALVGRAVLEEGVTPTTSRVGVVMRDSADGPAAVPSFVSDTSTTELIRVSEPAWLNNLHLVDTPGTNAVVGEHEQLTASILPRADVVVFVTSADRPFSESERKFLEAIWQWRKKVVVCVNKVDLLRTDEELARVMAFVGDNARRLLGYDPPTFALSGRAALERKLRGGGGADSDAATAEHEFSSFETYVSQALTGRDQLEIKLLSPLHVASRLAGKYLEAVRNRREVISGDVRLLDVVAEDKAAFRDEMVADIAVQVARVESVLQDMQDRGDAFLEGNVSLANARYLMSGSSFAHDFAGEVVSDVAARVDEHVRATTEWFERKTSRHATSVVDTMVDRASRHSDSIVGTVGSVFRATRSQLLGVAQDSSSRVMASYSVEAEARRFHERLKDSLLHTTALEVGAAGVGGLVAASMLDWTGLAGAGVLALAGLYILPARRAALRREFREHIGNVREGLSAALIRHLTAELDDALDRLDEAISPYSRFVLREEALAAERISQMEAALAAVEALETQVRAGPAP